MKMIFNKNFKNSLMDQILIMSKCKCGTSWVNRELMKILKKNKVPLRNKKLMKKRAKTKVKSDKTSQSFKALKKIQKILLNKQDQNYSIIVMKVFRSIRK